MSAILHDCLLQLVTLCLFSPQAIVVTADASWQISGDFTYCVAGNPYNSGMGTFGFAVEVPVNERVEFRYGVEHRSLFAAGDRGEERAFLEFTWRPFR